MTAPAPRIVVTNWVHAEVRAHLATLGEVDVNDSRVPWPRDEVLRRTHDADALLAFMPDRIDSAFLEACPRLRVVACALKGYDNFDVAACTSAGVWISIVPDLLTNPTAELAVGLTIGLGRRIREGDALVRSGKFEGWQPVLYGAGLDGATVVIIGMGAVGRAIAGRLAGFGCRLLGIDPRAEFPADVASASFDSISHANYVIVAAPLTSETYHLIGGEVIDRLKPQALVINVGRGSVVDESAIADALNDGRLGGYAADVFELEDWALPARPSTIDSRLFGHPRTLFTPHLGSAVDRVRRDIAMRAADNIADCFARRLPRDAINVLPRSEFCSPTRALG